MKHGGINKEKDTPYYSCRYCATHGWHGHLYPCPEYNEETLVEIRIAQEKFKRNVADPDWVQKQLDRGIPPHVISILKILG